MVTYFMALGRYDEGIASARKALPLLRDAELDVSVTLTLQHMAAVAALRPADGPKADVSRQRAARLAGYVDARLKNLEARQYSDEQEYSSLLSRLREALGENRLARSMAWVAGGRRMRLSPKHCSCNGAPRSRDSTWPSTMTSHRREVRYLTLGVSLQGADWDGIGQDGLAC